MGFIRIDGKSWQFMGKERDADPLPQVSRTIWPTHVIYEFEGAGMHLAVTFFTPALPKDLDVLSRPLIYLSWKVHATDGKPHAVQLYFAAGARLAVNDEHEAVVWGTSRVGDLQVMHMGTGEQPVLQKAGDNLRIDWGWADVAVPAQPATTVATIGVDAFNRDVQSGTLSESDDLAMPRTPRVNRPVLAVRFALGQVASTAVTRRLMLAYDNREAIEYFHRQLTDYWRRNRMTMGQMLLAAEHEETSLDDRAWAFDKAIVADLTAAGGTEYAQLAILAYQQTLGAHKLVADIGGTPMLFSKENFSNGCVDTVDVTYPAAPFFLLFNPKLLEQVHNRDAVAGSSQRLVRHRDWSAGGFPGSFCSRWDLHQNAGDPALWHKWATRKEL